MIIDLLSHPLADEIIIIILAAILFLCVYLILSWSNKRSSRILSRRIFTTGYFLRLAGFAILSLLVIGGGLMISHAYRSLLKDTAPAPSIVKVTDDLGFEVEEITFTTHDDFVISGWFIPPQNGATIILLHGYSGDRTHMIFHARALIEEGFGILMYDERASGESEGEYRSYGWMDPPDVGSALDYLTARPEVDPQKIGIAGCSIGGQISLQSAARYPQIKAIWADGPSGTVTADYGPASNWVTAIILLSNRLMDFLFTIYLDIDKPQPMTTIIGTIDPRPIMLIAGGKERPYTGAEAKYVASFFDAAGNNAQLWIIPEATHCDGPLQRPEEYRQRLVDFFTATLAVNE